MGDIVNLRRARKQRARLDAQTQAQQNRLTFGRTRVEREIAEATRDKAARDLDGHRLPGDDEPAK